MTGKSVTSAEFMLRDFMLHHRDWKEMYCGRRELGMWGGNDGKQAVYWAVFVVWKRLLMREGSFVLEENLVCKSYYGLYMGRKQMFLLC